MIGWVGGRMGGWQDGWVIGWVGRRMGILPNAISAICHCYTDTN